jgi:hypothetical protein
MIEAGLCGTDREICVFEYGTPVKQKSCRLERHAVQ